MRTKDMAIMAMVVLALAIVGYVAVTDDGLDATDATPVELDGVDIAIDGGVMTITADTLMAPSDVKLITTDLENVKYLISMDGMVEELTIVTLAYYEMVKPYVVAGCFTITLAEVDELGTEKWSALLDALDRLEVDTQAVTTTITVGTPVAIAEADAEALEEAVATVTEEKDAVIAEKDEIIASMFTQEQVDELIAEAVAGLYTEEEVILKVQEAVMETLENLSDYKYTDEDMAEAVQKAVQGVYDLYLTEEQITQLKADIEAKQLELQKAVARLDITQEEADRLLKAYAIEVTTNAIASKIIDAKDKIIAEKNTQIEVLQKELDEATKVTPEKPLWEQGVGQCLIIILIFLVALVLWFLFKGGYLTKLSIGKKNGGTQ